MAGGFRPFGGRSRQLGSQRWASQISGVIGFPLRIGHSHTKFATTSPTYSDTTSSPVPRRSTPARAEPRTSPRHSTMPSTRNGAIGVT